MAFSHNFLLDSILALSALHVSHVQQERSDILKAEAAKYYDSALRSFRLAVPSVTSANCHACFVFSTLIVIYAWAASNRTSGILFTNLRDSQDEDDNGVEWVSLLRGLISSFAGFFDEIGQGPVGALTRPWEDLALSCATISAEDSARFHALEQSWTTGRVTSTDDELSVLSTTLDFLKETYGIMLSASPGSYDDVGTVLSWPGRIPEAYIRMVKRQQPHALVLLAHYSLLLNKVDGFWYIRGMSRHLLQSIHHKLGREWEMQLNWPLQDLVLHEFRSQARSSTPDRDQ